MAKDEKPLPDATAEPVADYAAATPRANVENKNLAQWRKEAAYFDALMPKLWQDSKLRHKYVAVKGQKIVDFDEDKIRLAGRVLDNYPGEVVFIERVEAGASGVELSGPEVRP